MNKFFIGAAVALLIATVAKTQNDWTAIGANGGDQKYSTLAQINRKNVAQLRLAWTYDTGLKGASFEATPLVVKGTLYVTTPKDELIALNATTGKEIWKYDTGETSVRTSRGVSYWPGDDKNSPRIIMGTAAGLMIELDAETGKPVDNFGDHGRINIVEPPANPTFRSGFGETSPPAIYKNIAIMAPGTQEGPTRGETGNGDPRAFDILTGKQLWRFHSMPREGEFGSDTWGAPDGWKDRSGPSAWVPISVDEKSGVAFVATGNPADSYYGADRHGTNLYANCILALDATTGKLLWYYQMVHHDMWDSDGVGTALLEVHRNGTTIPAVAGLSKSRAAFHPRSQNRQTNFRRRGTAGGKKRRARRRVLANAAVSTEAATADATEHDGGGFDHHDASFGASLRGKMGHGAQQRPLHSDWAHANCKFPFGGRCCKLGWRFG